MTDEPAYVSKKRYDTLFHLYSKARDEQVYSSEHIAQLRIVVDDWIEYYQKRNSDDAYVKGALNSFLMMKEALRLLDGEDPQ